MTSKTQIDLTTLVEEAWGLRFVDPGRARDLASEALAEALGPEGRRRALVTQAVAAMVSLDTSPRADAEQVLDELTGSPEDELALWARASIAKYCIAHGDLDAAEEHVRVGLETAPKISSVRAFNFSLRAMLLGNRAEYDAALAAVDEGLAISDELNDVDVGIWLLLQRASLQIHDAVPGTAVPAFEKAANMASARGARLMEARAWVGNAVVFGRLGDPAESLIRFEAALERQRELGARADQARTLVNLAVVQDVCGTDVDTRPYLHEALRISEELDDGESIVRTKMVLAKACCDQGELEEAHQLAVEAEARARDLGLELLGALSHGVLAMVVNLEGDHERAIELDRETIARHEELGHPTGAAGAQYRIGMILLEKDRVDEALEELEAALPSLVLDRRLACLTALESAYERKGDIERTLRYQRLYSEEKIASLEALSSAKTRALHARQELAQARFAANEAQRRERELRKLHEAYFSTTLSGIFIYSEDGRLVDINDAACRMHDQPREAMLAMDPHEFIHPDSHHVFGDFRETLLRGEVFEGSAQGLRRDGTTFDVDVVGTLVTAEGVKYLFASVIDTSERNRALAEVERLRAMLEAEKDYLQDEIRQMHGDGAIVGRSRTLEKALADLERVAPTDATVLILGETGTGKELFARAVHDLSTRRDRTLVKVNCAAIAEGLVESELFGHEKGAFTGADQPRSGRFELADGGSIFLDEVGELPLPTQGKLLRVLQEREFERLGSSDPIQVDVRVLAATNRDLTEEVAAGRFREDLFYRLNVFPVTVPSLRERREDIPLLAEHFLAEFSPTLARPVSGFSMEAQRRLQQYDWPGNIRELKNLVERAAILAQGQVIDGQHLPDLPTTYTPEKETDRADVKLANVQRRHILEVLESTNWVIEGSGGASEVLALSPSTLRSRMRKLGIRRPSGN